MFKFKTLQSRLLMAFLALSLIICFFFIRFSTLLISTAEMNAFQAVLAQEEARILQSSSENIAATSRYGVLYTSMSSVPSKIQAQLDTQEYGDFVTANDQHFVYRKIDFQSNNYLLVMNLNTFTANQHLNHYKSIFLYSISTGAVVLCFLSSWYLSKLLSRPIELLINDIAKKRVESAITQATQENNFSIFGANREDEIGKLATELEVSYQEIRDLIKREQNFTRDVSHELRTPITLIKNTLTLKSATKLEKEDIALLNQASSELENTVEILLALARQENLQFTELKLLPIIEQAVLNIHCIYPDFNFEIDVDIDGALAANGNKFLIGLLFQNLINNGIHHGDGKGMRIYAKAQTVVFENRIDVQQILPSHQGLGHGHYLVERIAQEMDWTIRKEQSQQSYTVFITIKNRAIEAKV